MASVTLTVNNKSFNLACAEGDEDRLQRLAAYVDARLQDIAESGVVRQESQLMALTAIVLADELFELRESLPNDNHNSGEDFSNKLAEALQKQEAEYAKQVDILTETVEGLANQLKKA